MSSNITLKNIKFTYTGIVDGIEAYITSTVDLSEKSAQSGSLGISALQQKYNFSNEKFVEALEKSNRVCYASFAAFIPAKISLRDLFIPFTGGIIWHHSMDKICKVALSIFALLFMDLPTLAFRLITAIPRYLYNRCHAADKHPSLEDLELAGIKNEFKPSNIMMIPINVNEGKGNRLLAFSTSPMFVAEHDEKRGFRRSPNQYIYDHLKGILDKRF